MLKKKNLLFITCALVISITSCKAQPTDGSGTPENPYQISTPDQLDAVRNDLTANYVLTADIDLSGTENWTPIGSYDASVPEDDSAAFANSFSGSLDGDGHTISNLTVEQDNGIGIGLIGLTSGDAVVKNITVQNANCSGMMSVGTIIGYNLGTVHNLEILGDIRVSGQNCVGGILGGNMGGDVSGCSAEGVTVTLYGENDFPDGRYVLPSSNACGGLLIGGSFGGTVDGCSADGTIIAKGRGAMGIGGLSGCLENMSNITECSATVTIKTGENAHGIGGLCGFCGTFDASAPADISNCSTKMIFDCIDGGATHVGGLIGTGLYMQGNESVFCVTGCSAQAAITGAVSPGAIAGRAVGSTIQNSTENITNNGVEVARQIGQTETAFESAE